MTSWDGAPILTTPRLLLRTYRLDDLPLFAALNADPAVMATLGGEPLTREHSDDIAEWAQQRYAEERIGLLAVERREDHTFIGMCGLHHQRAYPTTSRSPGAWHTRIGGTGTPRKRLSPG